MSDDKRDPIDDDMGRVAAVLLKRWAEKQRRRQWRMPSYIEQVAGISAKARRAYARDRARFGRPGVGEPDRAGILYALRIEGLDEH